MMAGRRMPKWWSNAFISDWLVCVLCIVIVGILDKTVNPYDRYLPGLTDVSSSIDSSTVAETSDDMAYPNVSSSVPYWVVIVVGLLSMLTATGIFGGFILRSAHDVHHTLLAWFAGFTVSVAAVEALKLFAGRYRPNYLAVCDLNSSGQCTGSASDVKDAQQSFPSGHSATAFFVMTFLSLYLSGKFRVFAPTLTEITETTSKYEIWVARKVDRILGRFTKWSLTSVLPLVLAALVAVSRTRDYKHNFSDVLAGSVLGAACAVVSYFCYFNALWSASCHLALLPQQPLLDQEEMKSVAAAQEQEDPDNQHQGMIEHDEELEEVEIAS
eukprot:TRINITY_DN641_c0_g1_i1.p1 TRINITY_DN641_c0_g1~~TRINITY_DN641_c0_g1_i1.p1  ORF type:complete len:327 (-),score=74.46 TRINITY_DN641_c0_g1_i1:70-1050(-)